MSISVSPVNFSDGRFHLSFWTLCVAIFFAGVFARPDTVLALEQIFIIFYIVLLRALPSLLRMIKQHWVISVITLLWIISITISFFNSPFDLLHEDMALRRYIQTLTHVAFSFVLGIMSAAILFRLNGFYLPYQWPAFPLWW